MMLEIICSLIVLMIPYVLFILVIIKEISILRKIYISKKAKLNT